MIQSLRKYEIGLTILELLLVVAVLGILLSIGIPWAAGLLKGQEAHSSLNSLRQAFWQGATLASSRGERLELVRSGNSLLLRPQGRTQVLRRWDLSQEVSTDLPPGQLAVFTPPGKVELSPSFPNPFTVRAKGKSYRYLVSRIGEVKVEPLAP